MRRTDLGGVDLDEYRAHIRRVRAMKPEEKLREVCRLIEEKWASDKAYRASLFALPMVDRKVGILYRIAPDDPTR